MKTYYVYILKSSDNTYYIGFTSNITQRFEQHCNRKYKDSFTYSRRPLVLAFYCEFTDVNLAIATEKKSKNSQE